MKSSLTVRVYCKCGVFTLAKPSDHVVRYTCSRCWAAR